MSMKEAFDIFFEKRDKFYEKYEDVDLPLPMKPIIQTTTVNFIEIEDKLGFKIHISIKEFLSIYWFDKIEGFFKLHPVELSGIVPENNLVKNIEVGFLVGKEHFLKDNKYWYLGCSDPYSLLINNLTGEVTAVINDENKSIHIADSIEELIKNLECEI